MISSSNDLLDRLALRELVDAYALAADTADGDAVAALFTADGQLVLHLDPSDPQATVVRRGRAEIAAAIGGLRDYERTHHTVSSTGAEVTGDHATGTTRCAAHHVRGGQDRALFLRYDDEFRRLDRRWLFARRVLWTEWSATVPLQ